MCINEKEILNNSKFVDVNHPWRVKNIIKCGECVECLAEKQNEWTLRTQEQFKETIRNGGYVIFDTLTYSEENCPWSQNVIESIYGFKISDNLNFRCFDLRDVQKFFKKLRKKCPKDYIKYYLAAEYGTKEGKTHRPHYHIMIYLKDYTISPVDMSNMIFDTWQKGLTDGIKCKGRLYFQDNCLFTNLEQSNVVAQKYIQKYLCKQSEYEKRIKSKVRAIAYQMINFDRNFLKTYDGRLQILSIKRNINQFRKVSKGYGETYIKDIDVDGYIKDGYVIVDDCHKIKRKMKLPNYYKRKLYYTYDKDVKCWFENEKGIELHKQEMRRIYDRQIDSYNVLFEEIKNYDSKRFNEIKNILNLRSVKDYVYYLIFIRNRVYDNISIIKSVDDYIANYSNNRLYARNFSSRRDIASMEKPYILLPHKIWDSSCHLQSYSNYFQQIIMNERISEKFEGFEKIYTLIHEYKEQVGDHKQNVQDLKNRLENLFKKQR